MDGAASAGNVVSDLVGAVNIGIGDLDAFKPLFAWTSPDLL